MEMQSLIDGLHPLERKVIPYISSCKSVSEIIKKSNMQEVEIVRALQWLEGKKILNLNSVEKEFISLDSNGQAYIEKGLPERRLLNEAQKSIMVSEAMKKLGNEEFGVAVGLLKQRQAIDMKNGIISLTESGKKLISKKTNEEALLEKLSKGAIDISTMSSDEKNIVEALLKRKQLIQKIVEKEKTLQLTELGKKISKEKIEQVDFIEAITPDIIKTQSWKNKKFRPYDVTSNVPEISSAQRHFMNQAIKYIKQIWLEMGFEEMTGNYVETNFWDLDSLFVPQDHPARTMQDTFYVADQSGKNVLKGKLPLDYKKVKDVHENGAKTGSKGWQMPWSEELSKEIILRTHSTALSAHTISKLKETDLPKKYFAVGRVFRNETMDWKHLFEFEQVEGIVVDENVNFRHLLGYLKRFFLKMGFTDVRLRPGHFPYTEPSVEVEVYNPVKKEWVELGGAGIFRPEVTKTLIGKEVPVLAWGLGLARIAVEYWSIQDIRETYKNDLKYLHNQKMLLK